MTTDNLIMSTTTKPTAKVRFQTKGTKRISPNAQTINSVGSRRCSPPATTTQQANRCLDSRGNLRRESPNVMLSRDAETKQMMMIKSSTESCNGFEQRMSNYSKCFGEHSGTTINSGNKKHRQNVRNGVPAGFVQYFPQSTKDNEMPYSGRMNSSTPPRYFAGGPRRYTPPQISATFFAGSKMDVAPSPAKLPPPPAHWLNGSTNSTSPVMFGQSYDEPMLGLTNEERCVGLTSGLKMLLKVQ